jgi:hypothetical protein
MEEEFINILIKNNHVPANPEFLIGRHVGLDSLDILAEMNKRSMYNLLESVLAHLTPGELVRAGSVSTEWRGIVRQDRRAARRRVEFLKARRHAFERSKENRSEMHGQAELKAKQARPVLVRATNFGGYQGLNGTSNDDNDVSMSEPVSQLKQQPFTRLCQNRLANMHSFDYTCSGESAKSLLEKSASAWHSMDTSASGNTSHDKLFNELRATGPQVLGQIMSELNSRSVSFQDWKWSFFTGQILTR